MKINGIKVEMDHCLKNHVYLVDDKTRSVYYFDDNEKLNSIPEWEAVPLLKNGILTGMRREQYSPGIYLWHPEVQLDKIEKAAILTSQVRNGMNGCSFKRIKQKIAYGRKTGSVDLPDQSKRPWSPKTKKSLLNSEFDLERFITKIDRPSLKQAMEIFAEENAGTLAHGVFDDEVEALFPEYELLKKGEPDTLERDQTWIDSVMSKIHKSPYSRIRTRQADARIAELRAKGYQKKGNYKEDMAKIKLLSRTTDPQTVYIKDQMHRDDVVDITDFDVVAYQWKMMRHVLNTICSGRHKNPESVIEHGRVSQLE